MKAKNRYVFAGDDECGRLYRPGEMAIESLNYCRLAPGHGGNVHSTKSHEHDVVGFNWYRARYADRRPRPPVQVDHKHQRDYSQEG
jgi:hypothetical protein